MRVLASSREPLHVFGETSYPVPPLAVPESDATIALADLEQFEAANLFIDRARSAHPTIQLTPQNVVAVADICRRLDGIPLALELAAARVRALSVETIAARLNDRFSLLTRGDTTALPRQQTLRAMIDWSFELLTERERALLQRLAVFAGGWTLEAAEAVGAGGDVSRTDVLGLLANLVDKSLVTLEAEGERYRLLETVRQYAQERLNESGEGDQVHRRHLDFFLALAEQASSQLMGPDQGAWLARLDLEAENLLATHAECDRVEDGGELGLRLVFAVKLYLIYRGLLALLHRLTLEALARPGAEGRTRARCRALHAAGQVELFMGRYGEAQQLPRGKFVNCETDRGQRVEPQWCSKNLAWCALAKEIWSRPASYLEEALKLALELGNKRALASALNALAQLDRMECKLDTAEQLYERVIALARELEDQEPIAIGLLNLAMVSIGRGSRDRALETLTEALEIAEAIGSKRAGQSGLEVSAGLHASSEDVGARRRSVRCGRGTDGTDGTSRRSGRRGISRAADCKGAGSARRAGVWRCQSKRSARSPTRRHWRTRVHRLKDEASYPAPARHSTQCCSGTTRHALLHKVVGTRYPEAVRGHRAPYARATCGLGGPLSRSPPFSKTVSPYRALRTYLRRLGPPTRATQFFERG